VHLIYHASKASGRRDSLSLWMKRYAGSPEIEAGKVYAANLEGNHPLLVWRDQATIYYLVGDARGRTDRAAKVLMEESRVESHKS